MAHHPDDITIAIVGDVLLAGSVWGNGAADVVDVLRDACWAPCAASALILANLEAPITEQPEPADKKPYNFRTGTWATRFFDDRFVLSLANNHIMDYGARGLADTIDALDRAGIKYAGAGATLDRARAPHYRTVAGITTAVLSAADPRFGAATTSSAGTFPARPGLLRESIAEARRRARFVAVTIHMGLEHTATPSGRQVALAEESLLSGAQLVVFHHAHKAGGYSRPNRGLVLWATGNYVFQFPGQSEATKRVRTAAWRVRYSPSNDEFTELSIDPARLDGDGIPRPFAADTVGRERARLEAHGRRVATPLRRRVWRGLEMLGPGFLSFNLENYRKLLRLRGPWFVCSAIVAGVRAQLLGRR